jgi:hypothetical protein
MDSLRMWRNKSLATQAPVSSGRFYTWQDLLSPQDFANPDDTAPSTNNGGLVKNQTLKEDPPKPFELPHEDQASPRGLGDLGMERLEKTTFSHNLSLKAGRTPLLSAGIPVIESASNGIK